jgi:hypothetical protein
VVDVLTVEELINNLKLTEATMGRGSGNSKEVRQR